MSAKTCFRPKKKTQSTTASNRTHKLNTHRPSRRKEKEDEDEGHGFSQRGSKVAESNLSFLHQSGLSLSLSLSLLDFLSYLLNPKALLLISMFLLLYNPAGCL